MPEIKAPEVEFDLVEKLCNLHSEEFTSLGDEMKAYENREEPPQRSEAEAKAEEWEDFLTERLAAPNGAGEVTIEIDDSMNMVVKSQ